MFKISDSVAKDSSGISSENIILWQDQSTKAEHEESKKRSGVSRSGASNNFANPTAVNTSKAGDSNERNYSYLKIVQGLEHKEILNTVEVPIHSNAQLPQSSGHHGENEISGQDLAAAAKLMTARGEEIAVSEKDIKYKSPIPQHVLAARQTLTPSPTPGQSVVTTSMRTWTPEASYSDPVSPDSGLGRLTESRESDKSVFSSFPNVRGYGPSNGPMRSLPSLKDSLPSLRGSLPSLKESNPSLKSSTTSKNSFPGLRNPHPHLRDMAVITNYENHSEHNMFAINDASGKELNSQERNAKSFQNSTESNTTPMPFRLTRPWPLAIQVKPDSNDAQEITKALENGDRGNHRGIGGWQGALGDPLMHPAMYASNSLKATVKKAGRGSTPNRAAELMKEAMMRKNEETPKFTGDPLSTVKGTNYQRLMNEMRRQRKIEMEQKAEAERAAARKAREDSKSNAASQSSNVVLSKSESRSPVTLKTRLQPKNATSSSTRDSVSTTTNNKKTAKEDENNTSFIPQLSIITEDEICEERTTFTLKNQDSCPVLSRSSNTLAVPNSNQHLLKMDPLIKMLYQEISDSNDDTNDRSKHDPKGVGSGQEGERNKGEGEKQEEGEDKEIELTPELIERVRTAIIKRQLSKKGTRSTLGGRSKEAESPEELYGKDSILIAPPDVETLLKAAEFRGQLPCHACNF